MRETLVKQFKIIECEDAKQFETELNETLIKLSHFKPTVDVDVKSGFKAFISYEITQEIPETVAEQFNLDGITYRCEQCPHCERITKRNGSIDKRMVRAKCKHSHYGKCLIKGEACEKFYEWVVKGEIEPLEVIA